MSVDGNLIADVDYDFAIATNAITTGLIEISDEVQTGNEKKTKTETLSKTTTSKTTATFTKTSNESLNSQTNATKINNPISNTFISNSNPTTGMITDHGNNGSHRKINNSGNNNGGMNPDNNMKSTNGSNGSDGMSPFIFIGSGAAALLLLLTVVAFMFVNVKKRRNNDNNLGEIGTMNQRSLKHVVVVKNKNKNNNNSSMDDDDFDINAIINQTNNYIFNNTPTVMQSLSRQGNLLNFMENNRSGKEGENKIGGGYGSSGSSSGSNKKGGEKKNKVEKKKKNKNKNLHQNSNSNGGNSENNEFFYLKNFTYPSLTYSKYQDKNRDEGCCLTQNDNFDLDNFINQRNEIFSLNTFSSEASFSLKKFVNNEKLSDVDMNMQIEDVGAMKCNKMGETKGIEEEEEIDMRIISQSDYESMVLASYKHRQNQNNQVLLQQIQEQEQEQEHLESREQEKEEEEEQDLNSFSRHSVASTSSDSLPIATEEEIQNMSFEQKHKSEQEESNYYKNKTYDISLVNTLETPNQKSTLVSSLTPLNKSILSPYEDDEEENRRISNVSSESNYPNIHHYSQMSNNSMISSSINEIEEEDDDDDDDDESFNQRKIKCNNMFYDIDSLEPVYKKNSRNENNSRQIKYNPKLNQEICCYNNDVSLQDKEVNIALSPEKSDFYDPILKKSSTNEETETEYVKRTNSNYTLSGNTLTRDGHYISSTSDSSFVNTLERINSNTTLNYDTLTRNNGKKSNNDSLPRNFNTVNRNNSGGITNNDNLTRNYGSLSRNNTNNSNDLVNMKNNKNINDLNKSSSFSSSNSGSSSSISGNKRSINNNNKIILTLNRNNNTNNSNELKLDINASNMAKPKMPSMLTSFNRHLATPPTPSSAKLNDGSHDIFYLTTHENTIVVPDILNEINEISNDEARNIVSSYCTLTRPKRPIKEKSNLHIESRQDEKDVYTMNNSLDENNDSTTIPTTNGHHYYHHNKNPSLTFLNEKYHIKSDRFSLSSLTSSLSSSSEDTIMKPFDPTATTTSTTTTTKYIFNDDMAYTLHNNKHRSLSSITSSLLSNNTTNESVIIESSATKNHNQQQQQQQQLEEQIMTNEERTHIALDMYYESKSQLQQQQQLQLQLQQQQQQDELISENKEYQVDIINNKRHSELIEENFEKHRYSRPDSIEAEALISDMCKNLTCFEQDLLKASIKEGSSHGNNENSIYRIFFEEMSLLENPELLTP